MSNRTRILAATDFSVSAQAALKEAARLAKARDAQLSVVHVVSEELLNHSGLPGLPTPQVVFAYAHERLETEIAKVVGDQAHVIPEIIIGSTHDSLSNFVSENACDLAVLGGRGTGAEGLVELVSRIGSLASKCLRRLPCPVMIVRNRDHQAFQRVVACVDFSETSLGAARAALEVAQIDGARLDIVHADSHRHHLMHNFGSFSLSHPVSSDEERQNAQQAMEKFIDRLGDIPDSVHCTSHIIEGSPVAQTLSKFLNDHEADLAVLGTQGRGRLLTTLLGTTAEAIIHDSPCSVLMTKPANIRDDIDPDRQKALVSARGEKYSDMASTWEALAR